MSHVLAILVALAAAARGPEAGLGFEATYLYSLSTNFGALPLSGAGLSYDHGHREIYVSGDGVVRVFNESGMEIFSFGDSADLGVIYAVAALEDGNLLALARREGKLTLARCSYRGEFQEEIRPRDLPPELADFAPSVMRYRDGRIYLLDTEMRILVLDATGRYETAYDVARKLEVAEKRSQVGIRGFNVDYEGNVLFTIQPFFKAYLMTPGGEVKAFGQRGSAPGKFNVVSGIARDEDGYFYVADILKSAVLVFDPEFRFVKEFGHRSRKPGSLAAPGDVVVANDKLYVSSRGRKGVSVFKVGPRPLDDAKVSGGAN
jgi:hypothetical protein